MAPHWWDGVLCFVSSSGALGVSGSGSAWPPSSKQKGRWRFAEGGGRVGSGAAEPCRPLGKRNCGLAGSWLLAKQRQIQIR